MHAYIVLESDTKEIQVKQVLSEREYQKAKEDFGDTFRVGMGAESIQELLQRIDLDKESKELKTELKTSTGQKTCAYHQETGSSRSIPRVPAIIRTG